MTRMMTRFDRTTGALVATVAVATVILVLPAALPAHTAGLRICARLAGSAAGFFVGTINPTR
jgi:hypothetical protein